MLARAPVPAGPAPVRSPQPAVAQAISEACAALGARVFECDALPGTGAPEAADAGEEDAAAREADRALAAAGTLELLVVDGAGLYASLARPPRSEGECAGEGTANGRGRAALLGCLEASWNLTRAVVNRAFLARERGGRIVYIAPAADAGEHADAARAGLENLARTLSIEWARHAITTVAIAPGPATTAAELASLTAYIASPAGAYFSGCQLDLRGVGRVANA